MPIGNRSRWKFSFGRRSSAASSLAHTASSDSESSSVVSSSSSRSKEGVVTPPASFICPISSSLMYDPVILVPTAQTFDRACIQAYSDLPNNNPSPIFFIPNSALRAAIIDWCDRLGLPHPSPIPPQSARLLAHHFISTTNPPNNSICSAVSIPQSPPQDLQGKQREEEEVVVVFGQKDHKTLNNTTIAITTERQSNSSSTFSSSSSSSSSEIAANLTVSSSSSSSSSDDASCPKITPTAEPSMMRTRATVDPLEEQILAKLKSSQISVRESGVIALRRSTRDSPDCRTSLCTPRILAALLPLISPSTTRTSPSLRINATAALVNLSIDPPPNKVTIVRSGAVPPLVEALRFSSTCSSTITEEEEEEEARFNAAGALFSLSLEDGNKLAIGVLGAIPPLVHLFSQPSARRAARLEAGMALYHLSLAPNNLSKIAKTPGAVKAILNIAQGRGKGTDEEGRDCNDKEEEEISILLRLQRVAMMVLASLARRNEGRVALMDADAVKAMVQMMEDEREMWSTGGGSSSNTASSGKEEEYCLGVLYEMSRGSLRFRALARAAGAERVLISAVTASHQEGSRSGEVAKEMARRILKVIRGDHEERRMCAAMMLLRNNKTLAAEDDEEEEEEIGSVVSDGLVSFRRRYNDDFGGGSASNSANF